jgi:hypothetical protein
MKQSPSWESNRFSDSQEIPRILWNLRFITAFTSARQLSLSWANSTQSINPHPTSWRSILILSSHLRMGLPSGLFPLGFPHQYPVYVSPLPHTRYKPRPSHSSQFYHPNNIGWGVQIISSGRYKQEYNYKYESVRTIPPLKIINNTFVFYVLTFYSSN